jgi:small ligand-binding sensory domain FIST
VTSVGTGFSAISHSFNNGVEAAQIAMKNGNLVFPTLAICFTTSRHNETEFLKGVKSVIGDFAQLVGGLGVGFITNDKLGYDGYQSAIALFESNTIEVDIFKADGMHISEYNTGKKLSSEIMNYPFNGTPNLLVFYDAVNRTSGKLKINFGTNFVEGLYDSNANLPSLSGGGMMGDMQFGKCTQFFNNEIVSNHALAVAFSGTALMSTTIMHGCSPASAYHTVTKTDGTIILEINHIPAIDFVMNIINTKGDLTVEDVGFFITIGINQGDSFENYNSNSYSNFMCVNVDKKRGGLVMVENNIVEGTQIQLMRRALDFEYIYTSTQQLIEQIKSINHKPVFAFYTDCAGRAAYYMGTDREEAAEVQKALGNIPLLGFYSGVEISKVNQKYSPLDWTGVLSIISEPNDKN